MISPCYKKEKKWGEGKQAKKKNQAFLFFDMKSHFTFKPLELIHAGSSSKAVSVCVCVGGGGMGRGAQSLSTWKEEYQFLIYSLKKSCLDEGKLKKCLQNIYFSLQRIIKDEPSCHCLFCLSPKGSWGAAVVIAGINLEIFCNTDLVLFRLSLFHFFFLVCFHFQASLLPLDHYNTSIPRVRCIKVYFSNWDAHVSLCVCQLLHSNSLLLLVVYVIYMLVPLRRRTEKCRLCKLLMLV